MNCMFLPSLLGYDESIEGYEYNPDLAREYLAKTDYNGEKLTLYARNDLVAIDDVMAVFIQNLVDVGFNISTKICDSAEFVTIRQDPSAYDIFFVNLGAFDADPYTLYIIPRIVNDTHNSYYHNEELNNLIIDSYTTTDETKREDELKQAARIVYDECGPVWACTRPTATVSYGKAWKVSWLQRARGPISAMPAWMRQSGINNSPSVEFFVGQAKGS